MHFALSLRNLANTSPEVAKRNLHLVPLYGRWDDLYAVFGTSVEKYAIGLFLSIGSNFFFEDENKNI